ncbi:hypothetical protein H6P81_014025 [Aristolochia fimbriata]|uniref:Uncharacterized protein n=1 Tax=Aristolochia fimbriata TaxID=158543 RepID=A0AAV7EK04_ARIFI|nr:hypothetical protein H6P81_014025 [Aristolochia fimbriata]
MSRNKVDTRKKSPLGDVPNSIPIDTQAVTDFVTRYDEAAKRRLDNMNQKLMDLERQMESLETEMKKARDSTFVDNFDDYFSADPETFQFPAASPS